MYVGDSLIKFVTKHEPSKKIVTAYENAKHKSEETFYYERTQHACNLRRLCGEECILNECVKGCTNNELQQNQWKPTFYRNSGISQIGLFATLKIKTNEFIMEYLGKQHLNDEKQKNTTNNYLMQMELHYIDAENIGNNSRFINHSFQTNAKFVKKEVNGVQRCAIYALRDINSGEEITCDYGYDKGERNDGMVKCNCTKNCSNYFKFGKIRQSEGN